MFKAITSLAGIQRSMETIKIFARQQIDVEVRSQRDESTTRVFRGVFSQPADGLPPGGGGGADTGGAGRGGTGATSRGRGRGGRGGRGGGGRGGRGGGSRDGRGEGGGDPTTGAPGPVAGVPVPNPPAAASGAAHVTLEGPPVKRVRTRQGGAYRCGPDQRYRPSWRGRGGFAASCSLGAAAGAARGEAHGAE